MYDTFVLYPKCQFCLMKMTGDTFIESSSIGYDLYLCKCGNLIIKWYQGLDIYNKDGRKNKYISGIEKRIKDAYKTRKDKEAQEMSECL